MESRIECDSVQYKIWYLAGNRSALKQNSDLPLQAKRRGRQTVMCGQKPHAAKAAK